MLSLFVSVLMLLFGVASGLTREYIPVSTAKNWTDALFFCRQYYRDLAVITIVQENQRIHELIGKNYNAWIGMYRANPNVNLWLWSDRTPSSYYQWDNGQPSNNDGNQDCVEVMPEGWNDQFCYVERSFLCYRFLVLVKEKKTWEEAFHYCRMNYTGLASMASYTNLQLAEMESSKAQTDRIWTGLTFLNGKWVWVSGEPLGKLVSLPLCPDQRYRCGALNNKTHYLENRDCKEKLNFFCYY
ncbi:macrophage mannose receptor 1 [Tachysurus ichikawai]